MEICAYVNFLDTVSYFDQVVLHTANGPGFEASNHAVAFTSPIVASGTTFTASDRPPSSAVTTNLAFIVVNIPEPATPMMLIAALIVLMTSYHRRRAVQAAAESNAAETTIPRERQRCKKRSRPKQFGRPWRPADLAPETPSWAPPHCLTGELC